MSGGHRAMTATASTSARVTDSSSASLFGPARAVTPVVPVWDSRSSRDCRASRRLGACRDRRGKRIELRVGGTGESRPEVDGARRKVRDMNTVELADSRDPSKCWGVVLFDASLERGARECLIPSSTTARRAARWATSTQTRRRRFTFFHPGLGTNVDPGKEKADPIAVGPTT